MFRDIRRTAVIQATDAYRCAGVRDWVPPDRFSAAAPQRSAPPRSSARAGISKYMRQAMAATACVLALLKPFDVSAATDCTSTAIATLKSIQGKVEVRRDALSNWVPARLDQALCGGEEVRVGDLSRAQIRLQQDETIAGRGTTLLNLNQNSAIELPPPSETWWVRLVSGGANFLSRTPKRFTVRTKFANAKVEGTEFTVITNSSSAEFAVYEGVVLVCAKAKGDDCRATEGIRATPPADEQLGKILNANKIRLGVGEKEKAARVLENTNPVPIPLFPADSVAWTLYFPPLVVDAKHALGDITDEHTDKALSALDSANVPLAVAELDKIPTGKRTSGFYDLYGTLLLSVGRVDRARIELDKIKEDTASSLAIRSIIDLTQNKKADALAHAERAVAKADEKSIAPYIALSYAKQASFDLMGALESANEAARRSPTDSLAKTRIAELELSTGDIAQSQKTIIEALSLGPANSRAHSVAGFLQLAYLEIKEAENEFIRAIALDSSDPIARLGLGLAKIRNGSLAEGRKEIEIAANIDSNNSLIRSYLGKAYYEEDRGPLDEKQFDIAKLLDPADPTPWLYSALARHDKNQPVQALTNLEASLSKNNNRAPYRSGFLLDEDRAVRSSRLARIHRDLGFEQRALVEGWTALDSDPLSESGHRLLADTYVVLPRHEVARDSELLQAQLLQSINLNPVQPKLSDKNIPYLDEISVAQIGFNEYSRAFEQNNTRLVADAIVGSNSTYADNLTLSGIHDRISYSFGQFHYQTNGERHNNDIDQNVENAFLQTSISPNLSMMLEMRAFEEQSGDSNIFFDPHLFLSDLRSSVDRKSIRIGGHIQENSRASTMMTYIYLRDEGLDLVPSFGEIDSFEGDTHMGEFRQDLRGNNWHIAFGGGYFNNDGRTSIAVDDVLLADFRGTKRFLNAYTYASLRVFQNFSVVVGFSFEDFRLPVNSATESVAHPKFGLLWHPTPDTIIRAAAFGGVKRPLIGSQTIEPTSIAGFNQFFDDINGATYWRYGIGLDQKFSNTFFAGTEISYRGIASKGIAGLGTQTVERVSRSYINWAPSTSVAVNLSYEWEAADSNRNAFNAGNFANIRTHTLPFEIRLFPNQNVFIAVRETLVHQSGEFSMVGDEFEGGQAVAPGSSEFVVTDFSIGYKFPHRLGVVQLQLRNVTNETFRYQSLDGRTDTLSRGRAAFIRTTFSF